MRSLTIVRKRALASMFDKTWFYIEDEEHGKRSIDCIRCSLFCELKNGKSFTGEIPEGELRLFAVSGDFKGIDSPNGYASVHCVIPAGEENVTVTGRRKLNPAYANSFQFEDVETGLSDRRS